MVSPRTRRIVACAASTSPCARRSSARPGCGSRPKLLASLYAASADFVVALQAVELSLLVERLPGRRPVHRLLAAFAGQARLLERVAPRAVELHDPGAMREAPAGEGDHLRLLVAPAGEGIRPFVRAPRLEGLFAQAMTPQ